MNTPTLTPMNELISLKLANALTGIAVIMGVMANNPLSTITAAFVAASAVALNCYKLYDLYDKRRKNRPTDE